MIVNESQIEYIVSLVETCNKTYDEISTGSGISKSTISRLVKQKQGTKYTIDMLAAYFEVGDKIMELGGQDEKPACPLISGVSGELKRLEGVYVEREARVQSQCDERVAALNAQLAMMQKHHEQALQKRDETCERSVAYLKSQVETMKEERADLQKELGRQTKRADDLDRKRHNVFWGMLSVILLLLVLMAVMMIVDAPGIGMGWA